LYSATPAHLDWLAEFLLPAFTLGAQGDPHRFDDADPGRLGLSALP
jgi:hypothetical protein